METEMKDKKQLNQIIKRVEKNIGKRVIKTKCYEEYIRERFIIGILIEDRQLFLIESYKDENKLEKEIDKICNEYKEKQNSIK